MIKSQTGKYGETLYILYPGDFYASNNSCILGTIIGTSVLVCLYDTSRQIGGMCHFIVPGAIGTEGIFADQIAVHGIQSLEMLLGEIVKLGGDRRYLKAKLFGAGYLQESVNNMGGLAESNIKFLHEYFKLENIKVESEDLGGNYRRKIYFYPIKGTVFRKPQRRNEDASEFRKMETEYIDRVFRDKGKYGNVILFD